MKKFKKGIVENKIPTQKENSKLKKMISAYSRAEYDAAEAHARELLKIFPDLVVCWKVLGSTLKKSGKLDQALEANENAISLSPGDFETHYNAGNTLRELKRPDRALQEYSLAISLNPKYPEAHYNKGVTFEDLSRPIDAKISYLSAICLEPNHVSARLNLANIYCGNNDHYEAEAEYRKIIKIVPNHVIAYARLADTLQKLNRHSESENTYRRAIKLDPNNAPILNNLAQLLHEAGKFKESLVFYRNAISIDSTNDKIHVNLGLLAYDRGQRSEALASFRKALEINPNNQLARHRIGVVLYDEQHYSSALEYFSLSKFRESHGYALRCFLELNKSKELFSQLQNLENKIEISAISGSVIARANQRFGYEVFNPFVNKPFEYIHHKELINTDSFCNTLVKFASEILTDESTEFRQGGLLVNSEQTTGNLLRGHTSRSREVMGLINREIEFYKEKYKRSEEGFFTNWPEKTKLTGWLLNMHTGGKIKPHMHENGWLSGAIYINVPKNLSSNAGNFVVMIDDEKSLVKNCGKNETFVEVVTGSLVLFPSSLLHYTIPFNSSDTRTVLAFDLLPD